MPQPVFRVLLIEDNPGDAELVKATLADAGADAAAEATTIINALDYGRSIHDLAVRRELIQIGEDVVNVAYDAPGDSSPRDQIEEAERIEAACRGRAAEPEELISAALDAVARDYFARTVARATSQRKR